RGRVETSPHLIEGPDRQALEFLLRVEFVPGHDASPLPWIHRAMCDPNMSRVSRVVHRREPTVSVSMATLMKNSLDSARSAGQDTSPPLRMDQGRPHCVEGVMNVANARPTWLVSGLMMVLALCWLGMTNARAQQAPQYAGSTLRGFLLPNGWTL